MDDGIEYDVEDEMCDEELKPNTKEKCNKQECRPEWVAQPFGTVREDYFVHNESLKDNKLFSFNRAYS